jgi:hypothetical protein
MSLKKESDTKQADALIRAFKATKTAERRVLCILKICRRAGPQAPSILGELKALCGCLAFDEPLTSCLYRADADDRIFLIKPREPAGHDWQELPCDHIDELEWIGWVNNASTFVGRRTGDASFHTVSVHFSEATGQFIWSLLGVLTAREYRQMRKGERWPITWKWGVPHAGRPFSQKKKPTANRTTIISEKLASPSYRTASDAVAELVKLPARSRARWVPLLLRHAHRFRDNSEWWWIIESLPPHYARHRKQIESELRKGLKSEYDSHCVFEFLHQAGPAASAMVPDVLAYISRQDAITNEEPHLVHIDPQGKKAIPGLIRLLRSQKETVRFQVASELEAYGQRAESAVPILTELLRRKPAKGLRFDLDALRSALNAIRPGTTGAGTGPAKSASQRLLDLAEKAVTQE